MRRCGLRHLVMRFWFHGVDQIRKFHRVLDEEHRDIVADQIPVALVTVEFHCEPAGITRGIGRAALARDG